MKSVEELIREYITSGQTRMLHVASCIEGQPWIFTCYYVFDEGLNLYWMSLPTRRHSKEIAINPKVAATVVYDQQPPRDDHRGVVVEGEAMVLEGQDAEQAADLYQKQLNSDQGWIDDVKSDKDPHRVYRLKPKLFVLYDDVNFPEDSRREWAPH